MESTNYTHILPKPECPPRDALYALVDRVLIFSREWLFQAEVFVDVFRQRLIDIMQALPQDKPREDIEEQLTYIHNTVRDMTGVLVFSEMSQVEVYDDVEKDIFTEYRTFSQGMAEEWFSMDSVVLEMYLHMLYLEAQKSLEGLMNYIRTLDLVIQIDGVEWTLTDHVEAMTSAYADTEIQAMIDQYGYVWYEPDSYDGLIYDAMHEDDWDEEDGESMDEPSDNPITTTHPSEEGEWLTLREAEVAVDEFIEFSARLHLFLRDLYVKHVKPRSNEVSEEQWEYIKTILNSVRDYLDGNHLVPLIIPTDNYPEIIMREVAIRRGWDIQ